MRVIEGFPSAKEVLSRQASTEPYPVSPALRQRLKRMFGLDEPELVVRQIIDEVRQRGDAALFDYTLKIDGLRLASLEVSKSQISRAYRKVAAEVLAALRLAAERVRSFHSAQRNTVGGVALPGLRQLVRPLERAGVYIPGGTASYPSTVLMTVIPARVAGVREVILVTPPGPDGKVPALTLVAADIAGADQIFSVGGAQAIAALAFGTGTIPRVDKICGPGNIFVLLAKKLVYGVVGIDGLQGPSEILVIADETADPACCAADLLAQAEHDPLASAILITTSRRLADAVNQELERQLATLPRREIASESLENSGVVVVVASLDEAIELANLYAPEHLCLMVDGAPAYIERIVNAGCIVAGEKATVVLGDYVAGPSHVLPTSGTARFGSPLNVSDFMKLTSLITVDEASLKELGQAAPVIARAEGFEAHARAVEKRRPASQ